MKKILLFIICMIFIGGCSLKCGDGSNMKGMAVGSGNMGRRIFYIDLMEKTLAAYSTAHIDRYFSDVKRDGLTEHGFPRLTANIGILIAHDRRTDLKERFLAMMDFCCRQIPKVKAANEFSVKEIIFCIEELEKSQAVPADRIAVWKNDLRTIDPVQCYTKYAVKPEDIVHNWAAFGMLSEYVRKKAGLTVKSNDDFIDMQAYSQLHWLDSNNMYRDPGSPAVYDFVTRGLFAQMLREGYQGKYKDVMQKALESCAMPTYNIISVTGELPAGGRSQQFLHNEAHVALMMEYYAGVFAKKGNLEMAGKCRTNAIRALQKISEWLDKKPISHIKNRFPVESRYGCEKYAYFDKYMITTASFLYAASRFCDDSIVPVEPDDNAGMSWQSSDDFHMVYLRAGGYTAQYDYDARQYYNSIKSYDCSGMARLHKKGAPSEICLSISCTDIPSYSVGVKENSPLAIAPGMPVDGKWLYATDRNVKHIIKSHNARGNTASVDVGCRFPNGKTLNSIYTLNRDGLNIRITGNDEVRCLLPVFRFNGETYTRIQHKENVLTIEFDGFVCKYQVLNGTLKDLGISSRNRNGYYDSWVACGKDGLTVQISIEKI